MAVHLVQRSRALLPCSRARAEGDVVVLLGEGVNALLLDTTDCFACESDVAQRGLTQHQRANVTLISDAQLVALCVEHTPIVTWTKA